jgi:hypothetical protein
VHPPAPAAAAAAAAGLLLCQVFKREDADFMLGTCHKGKGQEEMYAQVGHA